MLRSKLLSALLFLLPILCYSQAPADESVIPFTYINHIFLETQINDSLSATLLYDPVQGMILDERFTRRHDIPSYGGEEVGYGAPVRVRGAGAQEHIVTFVRNATLGIQDERFAFNLTPVIPLDSMMALAVGRSVDGLFGIDVLNDYVLEFDFLNERFVLHDPVGFEMPAGYEAIPITRLGQGRKPCIPITLQINETETVEGFFVLDFGMGGVMRLTTGFTESENLTERIQPYMPSNDLVGLGGQLQSLTARLPSASLGSIMVEDLTITMAQEKVGADAYPPHQGLIGLGLLDRFSVLFDAKNDVLMLKPTRRFDRPFMSVRTGVRFQMSDDQRDGLFIRTVEEGSAAEDAGLQPGDHITQVADQTAVHWNRRHWQEMMVEYADRPVQLTIERDGVSQVFELTPQSRL